MTLIYYKVTYVICVNVYIYIQLLVICKPENSVLKFKHGNSLDAMKQVLKNLLEYIQVI